MLYDIVPIPIRYREGGEIDNVIPIFSNEEMLDDVEWVGWYLDVDAIIRCGCYKYKTVEINGFKTGELTQRLYDTLTGIQFGKLPDTMGWIVKVD